MHNKIMIASAYLSDDLFLLAFTGCKLPLSSFCHGDHLRLAWLLLHREPFQNALQSVRQGIHRFATFHSGPYVFHETITRAWVTLLATHSEPDFEAFLAVNESGLTRELLHRFWTAECLSSEAARLRWVPPDKAELPSRLR